MRDSDVRAAVLKMLNTAYRRHPDTRIVQEMGVWSGTVRIDVAVINGLLHGLELKSELDTLDRLPHQACLYSQVFDRMTLVTAARHVDAASFIIPQWWGLTLALETRSGKTTLKRVRSPRRNPDIDPLQLARLLWRPEAVSVMERHGIDRGFRGRHVELIAARIADRLPLNLLRREVRDALRGRQGWLRQPVNN